MSSDNFFCTTCKNCIDRYLFDCAIRKIFPEIIQKLEINVCNGSYVCKDCATYDIPLIPSYLLSHITEICFNENPKFINSYAVRANGYITVDTACKMIHTSNTSFAQAIKEKFNYLLENENREYHLHENEECDMNDNMNEEETQPLIANDEHNTQNIIEEKQTPTNSIEQQTTTNNEEKQTTTNNEEKQTTTNNEEKQIPVEQDKLNLHEQFFYSTKRFIREMNTYQLYLYSIHSETEVMKNLHKITSCTELTHINSTEFTENDMIDYEKTNKIFITQLSNVYRYGRDNDCDCEEHSVSEESSECACEESSECDCNCKESCECEFECKSYTKNNEETDEETDEETNEETNEEDTAESETIIEESNKNTSLHPSNNTLINSSYRLTSCVIA